MRYWFSQLHSQGDGNHSFLDLEGQHNDDMQFHLNVMACLPCTSVPLNSCKDAKNHNRFLWISIRQIQSS